MIIWLNISYVFLLLVSWIVVRDFVSLIVGVKRKLWRRFCWLIEGFEWRDFGFLVLECKERLGVSDRKKILITNTRHDDIAGTFLFVVERRGLAGWIRRL